MSLRTRKKKTSQIFREFAELEENVWWKELFIAMSEGKFPHRISYSNHVVFFKKKSTHISHTLDPNFEKLVMAKQFKEFLTETVGLTPDSEIKILRKKRLVVTWEMLNKNSDLRNILVHKYLSSLEISSEERETLKRKIWWGFITGIWIEKTFTIEENKIVNFEEDQVKIVKKRAKRNVRGSGGTALPAKKRRRGG